MATIRPRLRPLRLRRLAAVAIALLALESVVYGLAVPLSPRALPGGLIAPDAPGGTWVAALVLGLALLALMPGVWRGTRTSVAATIMALLGLAAVNALAALLAQTTGHTLARVLRRPVGHALDLAATGPPLDAGWNSLIEVLIGGALVISVVAMRSALSPARADNRHSEHEYQTARAIVDTHGSDSLSPFLLRPDKALAFAAGGVLSYRVIGGTAVVSADPVAPGNAAGDVLAGFQRTARRRGWQLVVWGASDRHLDAYRRLGLRTMCVGEEAFVDPAAFSLEGRGVRKLRQSVHRVGRRGWKILVCDGRDVDAALEGEIVALVRRWRLDHPRLHGFAMGMGAYGGEMRADDLYLLARSPDGELGAVMRFVMYAGNLSLDTMQRVGATPNGLNEALVARALAVARERGIPEVSLNYAGLAHLVRGEPSWSRVQRAATRLAMAPLHRRFQMDRLVRFNEKFSPRWRRRYLVYESRSALPRAIVRVLQAEGYLRQPRPAALLGRLARALPRLLPDRPRHRRALSEPR